MRPADADLGTLWESVEAAHQEAGRPLPRYLCWIYSLIHATLRYFARRAWRVHESGGATEG